MKGLIVFFITIIFGLLIFLDYCKQSKKVSKKVSKEVQLICNGIGCQDCTDEDKKALKTECCATGMTNIDPLNWFCPRIQNGPGNWIPQTNCLCPIGLAYEGAENWDYSLIKDISNNISGDDVTLWTEKGKNKCYYAAGCTPNVANVVPDS